MKIIHLSDTHVDPEILHNIDSQKRFKQALNHIKDNHIHIHVPGEYEDCFPPEPTSMPVKRIHSRHRRFIAPGATWQIRVSSSSRRI